MAKDQDATFNISSDVIGGGGEAGAGGQGVPYPDAPAAETVSSSASSAPLDFDVFVQQYARSDPSVFSMKPARRETVLNAAYAAEVARVQAAFGFGDGTALSAPGTTDMVALGQSPVEQGMPAAPANYASQNYAEAVANFAPGAYGQYRQRRGAVERRTQDFFAAQGQGDLVGTAAYQDLFQQNLLEEGLIGEGDYRAGSDAMFGLTPKDRLAPVERAVENVRESASGFGALNYGYAASQLAEGGARLYEQTNTGHTLTQEAQTTAAGSVLPGAMAVAGTVVGAALGGEMGAWAGGIVGAGVGTAAQGVLGTNEDLAQSTRQSAELLAAALGQAADSVANFRSQIEQTGAPAKDFAAVLNAAGGAGNFGPGTAAGVGALTNALGEYAQGDAPVIGKYASEPINYAAGRDYGAGHLSAGDIDSLAFGAAIDGDFGGLKVLQRDAQRKYAQETLGTREHAEGAARRGFHGGGVATAQIDAQYDARAAAAVDPNAAAENALADAFAGIKAEDLVEQPQAENARGRLGILTASGGSVAAVSAAAGAYESDLSGLSALSGRRVKALQAAVASPLFAGLAPDKQDAERQALAQAETQGAQYGVEAAGARREAFGYGLGAETSAFGLGQTRAELSGQAAGAERGAVMGQAGYLQGVIDNPASPLSPQERSQLGASRLDLIARNDQQEAGDLSSGFGLARTRAELSGASAADLAGDVRGYAGRLTSLAEDPSRLYSREQRDQMQTTALSAVHENLLQNYGQALAGDDLGIGRASLGVARAEASGTAGDVSSAQGAEIEAFRTKVAELTGELQRGGLTFDDRIAKERELQEVQRQGVELPALSRRQYAATTEGNAADDLATLTVGLDRQMRVGGSASVDAGAVDRAGALLIGADRAGLAAAPLNSAEWHAAQRKLAADTQALVDTDDSMNVYQPGARLATQEIQQGSALRRAEHGFSRSLENPYADGGPESSPFTRGTALEAEIGRSSALVGTEIGALNSFRDGLVRQNRFDAPAQQKYAGDMAALVDQQEGLLDRRASLEHDRVFNAFAALPEMVAGTPGAGVSAGVLPTAAMAAFFTPGPQFGGFGRTPGESLPGAGAAVREGGVYGGFNQATGAGETVQVLRQILAQLSGNRPPLVTSAPVNSLGAIVSQEHATLDWTRRR